MSAVALARPCPACGRERGQQDLRANGYSLLRCSCGLKMLDGIDDALAMTANTETYDDEEYNRWYRSMKDVLMERYANDLREIGAVTGGTGAILDVGCAYGWFLEAARDKGWSATGVEVEDATASVARDAGIRVLTGTLHDAGFDDSTFDVVALWDVLEHVPDTDAFLAECRRVLKPGGILAIQSPNVRSVMARVAGDQWSWLLLPQHIYHFTPRSMRRALERRGFSVARAYTYEPPEAFRIDLAKRAPLLAKPRVWRALRIAERAWCAAGWGGLLRVYARREA